MFAKLKERIGFMFRTRGALKINMVEDVPKDTIIWCIRAPFDLRAGDSVTVDLQDGVGPDYVRVY